VRRAIVAFVTHLATDRNVAHSTQNQALAAVLFLFNQVLRKQIGFVQGIIRAKASQRLPIVLTPDEVRAVLAELEGVSLRDQLRKVEKQFALDLGAGLHGAAPPGALLAKFPNADRELALAVRVSGCPTVYRGQNGDTAAPPLSSVGAATTIHERGQISASHEARNMSLTASLIRDAPPRRRNGHSHDSGITWPHRSENDNGVHARCESRRARR
jgi:hypothetical protein